MPCNLTVERRCLKADTITKINYAAEYKSNTLIYHKDIVQGHLYKDKRNGSIFFSNKIQRYFVLDHRNFIMYIYSDNLNYKLSD